MTPPAQRRRDPQPIGRGWELAAAAVGGVLIAAALAALTGLAVASALFGGGWVWPHGSQTLTHVLGGLLHGHPGRGLPADQLRRVPGPLPVYVCVAASELALLATAARAGVLITRYRRPGDARGGMATRRETEQALGLGSLRPARAIIRPDLYGPTEEAPTASTTTVTSLSTGCTPACGPSTDPYPTGLRSALTRHREPAPRPDEPTRRGTA